MLSALVGLVLAVPTPTATPTRARTATAPPPADLLTTAEQTGFQRTGRLDEVERLCRAHERAYPRRVRCFEWGRTPEGRPLLALAASDEGLLRPEAARARKRPVVLAQGAIHAGELDGKDAGFILLRELLAQRGGPLSRAVFLFVPVLNADGHERFGPGQRPNQLGPQEAGWRVTAQNLNLNRDFTKADAPETRALLALLAAWDPILYLDLHVTDGAQFQHDVSLVVEPRFGGPPALREEGRGLSAALVERLRARGHLPLDFYPTFVKGEGDPESGFAHGVAPPRFCHGYWAERNRLGVLVEAHSWKDYRTRVTAAVDTLRAALELAGERGARWRAAAERAEAEGARLGGSDVALTFAAAGEATTLEFLGYAFSRTPSAVSGRLALRWDTSRRETLRLPFRARVEPALTVRAPRGGWLVPAAHAGWMGERLRLHGVRCERLAHGLGARDVEAFRAEEVRHDATSTEGRQRVAVKGTWQPERREVAAGALFVPVAQPLARLALHLLEPEAPDGFLAWGFLSAHLEKREYLEDYVAEAFAADLLSRDEAVRAEFERRLAGDEAFARDPAARLEFFHRRHPSWDERFRLYPVLRTPTAP